ncbi:MAG: long-chain fatty acid--CoA ligase [Nitrospiraceae bacterium]|nr:MAG: long-chain fatty acid--CoA ligase [Nitrospiraceae bacterium]
MTLSAMLSERAENSPKSICIKFEKRKITCSELDAHVSRVAGGLKSLGLGSQERVAVLMDNCPEYIISYFAVLRAGGIVVPVNIFLTPDEISFILRDCGCKVLICGKTFLSRAEVIKKNVPSLQAVLFDEIPAGKAGPDTGNDDDVAALVYTSGTTGFPKGAMLTHKNLLSNAEACMKAMDITSRDRILLFLPLFHSFSFTVCVVLPIYAGARIILLASVRPFSKVVNSIFRDRITFFVAVPTVYNILSRKKMPFPARYLFRFFMNIRACVSGAAALPEETIYAIEKRFGVPLIEGYGLTEAAPVVAVNPMRGVRKPTSVGPPVPGVEVAVMGEDGGRLPAGEIGELIVTGPNIMKGYFNRPEETSAVLKDGWLYTGDMARTDEDGYIYIVDRKKDLIIIDGMNVYPREVEDFVMKHASVEECAMVGVPDGRGSETAVLFIKRKENAVLEEGEIRDYMKGSIAQFKTPRKVMFIDEFPRTATGKIKKTELRKQIITQNNTQKNSQNNT